MHNYTVADVEADGFDMSLLKIDKVEVDLIVDAIIKEKELLSIKQRAINPSYPWIDTRKMVVDMNLTNEQYMLSMLFDQSFIMAITRAVDGSNMVYPSWSLLSEGYTLLGNSRKLAIKAFYCPTVWAPLRDYIVNMSYLSCGAMLDLVKDKTIITLQEGAQLKVLELCDGSDAPTFFKSNYEKIRLAAYKKVGPVSNLDAMIADSNWTIRQYAIGLLDAGDKRLASFISDKSLNVFCAALQKIDSGLLPMMFGSYHMKKGRAKDIVKERLNSGK